jgi:hypothetical protein
MDFSSISSALNSVEDGVKDIYNSVKGFASTATAKTLVVDKRIRLRPKAGAEDYVYGNNSNLLSILRDTNGLVWNNTPMITESHEVKYSVYEPTHNIAKFNNFEGVNNVVLQVTGDFYANNSTEAKYLLAVIHFLRSITMMEFGKHTKTPGIPPPILLFSGYGTYMYNDISVLVKNVNFSLQPDIDYVQVPITPSTASSNSELNFLQPSSFLNMNTLTNFYKKTTNQEDRIWVPTKMTISMTLEQQPTADWLSNEFNLSDFKNGTLLKGGGFI